MIKKREGGTKMWLESRSGRGGVGGRAEEGP